MAQLYNKDILLDASFDVGSKQALKEWPVLGEASDSAELVLEVPPNVMGLQAMLLLASEQDLAAQDIVVLFRFGVEASHLLALHEAVFLVRGVLEDLEEAFALVVVRDRVVCQLNKDVDVRRCRGVNVVQATLWHLAQYLVQLSLHQLVLDGVEVVDGHVVEGRDQRVLELRELGVGLTLCVGCLRLDIVREVLLLFFSNHSCLALSMLRHSPL